MAKVIRAVFRSAAVCLFVELLSFVDVPPSVTFVEVLDLLVFCHENETLPFFSTSQSLGILILASVRAVMLVPPYSCDCGNLFWSTFIPLQAGSKHECYDQQTSASHHLSVNVRKIAVGECWGGFSDESCTRCGKDLPVKQKRPPPCSLCLSLYYKGAEFLNAVLY